MIESVYQILAKIGYTHPLHPPATHLPAGLIIGGFLFALFAWIFNRKTLDQTARHCFILALIMAVPTILLGLMDWQYRFGGADIFEINMKLILAGVLLLLLLVVVIYSALAGKFTKTVLALYTLCFLAVIGLGYFGGELVYGSRPAGGQKTADTAVQGEALFRQNCSACHHTDTTAKKVGPGLKGIFKQAKFPVSGQPVSDDNFRQILKTPVAQMPPFAHLNDAQVNALLAYLKTL